ncbi:MAG: tyrosine-type recombinase/integrase [Methanobacterium sp.]|jgi:integrase|nr:tyrosine-type recombinase/integrase [Methanobacterium sp.]
MTESDIVLLDWFTQRGLSKNTRKGYKDSINRYINFLNREGADYTPEKLLKEAEEEQKDMKILRQRKITSHIISYISHLDEIGNSPGTFNNRLAAILSFYETFDVETPFIAKKKGNTVLEKNQGPILTREEISKLIDVANQRDAVIIYTMSLTGLAQNEIRKLTIRQIAKSIETVIDRPINNLKELLESEREIKDSFLILHLKREKANHSHFSFFPPEAHKRIFAYLKTRLESNNPKIHPDLDGFVFVNRYGDQLTTSGFTKIFTKLGERNNFSHQEGAFRKHRSHGLRKYFISTISNNTGDLALADYLVGHVPDRNSQAYNAPDEKKYLERYKQAYPSLSIDQIKMKDYTSPEYKEINKKLQQRDKEITGLNSVIYDLKDRLDALEEEKKIKSDADVDNIQDIVNEAVKRLKENPNEKERILLDAWDEYEPASE